MEDMKKAIFLAITPAKDNAYPISTLLHYCEDHHFDLTAILHTSLDKLVNHPDSIYQELANKKIEVVLCDDLRFLFPEMEGYANTLIDEFKRKNIDYINVTWDIPMESLMVEYKKQLTETLCQQSLKAKGLIIYKGLEDYKENDAFHILKNYMLEKIEDSEMKIGCMVYQKETKEFFRDLRNVVANNPIQCIAKSEQFTSELGKEFIQDMHQKEIEIAYYDAIKQEQEQVLWQM